MNKKLKTPTPGDLLKEILTELGISNYKLARATGISATGIGEIIAARRRITPDTAMRIGKALNMTPQFWMNAQTFYDLREPSKETKRVVDAIKPLVPLTPKFATA